MKIKKVKDSLQTAVQNAASRKRDVTNRTNAYYGRDPKLSYYEALSIYQQNAVTRNAIHNITDNMFKHDYVIENVEEKYRGLILKLWDKYDLVGLVRECMKSALIGGHSIICVDCDGADISKPLTNKNVFYNKRLKFYVFDDPYISVIADMEVGSPGYMTPLYFNCGGKTFHKDWVTIFTAVDAPRYLRPQYKFMGMSYLEGAYQTILNDDIISRAIPNIIYRSSVVNYKLNGFKTALKNGAEQQVLDYISVSEDAKNYLSATVCDSEDTVEILTRDMSNLPHLDERSIYRLSAAFKQPATILLGKSPDGLHSTREKDKEVFFNFIEEWQEHWKRPLEKVLTWLNYSLGDHNNVNVVYQSPHFLTPQDQVEVTKGVLEAALQMQQLNLDEKVILRFLYENNIIKEEEMKENEMLLEEMMTNAKEAAEREEENANNQSTE